MGTIAAILLATIFFAIAILHVYWVFGGKWGINSSMPDAMKNHVMADSRRLSFKVATLLVAIGLFLTMYLFLILADVTKSPLAPQYLNYATYAVCGIFLLRAIGDFKYCGFFKQIKEGDFARNDSKYFSPLCLLIALLTIIVIFS